MKKWICLISCGLLVSILLLGSMRSFTFAGASDDWNIGDARIADEVTAIVIESGDVNVFLKTGTDKEITIEESSLFGLSDNQKVRWQLDGTTLRLKYENSVWGIFSFLLGTINHSLTVTVPEDLVLDSLEIDVASADLTTDSLQAKTAVLESASGDLSFGFTGEMETISFTSASGEICAALENAKEVSCGSASGNVAVALTSAETLTAETSSGDIDLTLETAGQLTAEAVSGEIGLTLETAGSLTAETTSGEINLTLETAGQLTAEAVSGEIYVQANTVTDLNLSTTSGEISATLGGSPEIASISTSSGDVALTLPENADLTIEISTSSGDFSSQLAMAMDGNRYTCGNGTGQMNISTASGDIRILKGE